MSDKIAAGDLVEFYSGFDAFQRGYDDRNPGIVLTVDNFGGWAGKQKSAEVLWSNGHITAEHAVYLRRH